MAVPLDPGVAVLRAQYPGAYDDLDDDTLAAAQAAQSLDRGAWGCAFADAASTIPST